MAQRKKISIRMIADTCGVSTATVSRVINNENNVTEETRHLVLDAVERLGYIPPLPAPGSPKVDKIGVIITASTSDYYHAVLASIGKYFRRMDISVVAMNTEQTAGYLPRAMDTLYDCNIQGLILVSCDYLSVRDNIYQKIPHVWIDCNDPEDATPHICRVQSDHYIAGKLAAQELFQKGCTKPVMITGSVITHRTEERIRGFVDGSAAAGIHINEEQIIHLPNIKSQIAESKEMIRYMAAKGILFDSIFADSDARMLGSYEGVRSMGYSIPGDVRIIGFDGISDAVTGVLNITCIQQNVTLLTQSACEMLLQLIHKQTLTKNSVVIPVNILPGQTL